ncbi:MAG: hypothetical protein ABI388_06300 [Bacteroidia bacterium]
MKAFKLININDTESSFLEGSVKEHAHIQASHFLFQTDIETYEKTAHPAPRYQFVITLKGRLKFTVTNGDSFIIEPGIILIANDLKGKGHRWEILDGDEWQRVYIVPPTNAEDFFIEK